jgi:GTPase Era involved in 16S rRNA processing
LIRPHQILRPKCPYCGKLFLLANTPFACQSSPDLCQPTRDQIYATARGLSQVPLRPRVTQAPDRAERVSRFVKGPRMKRVVGSIGSVASALVPLAAVSCEGCGAQTRQRLCPHCSEELPDNVGTHDSFRVAVIGPPQSGKSHFIAAQAEYLERLLGPNLGMSIRPLGRTRLRVSNYFHRRIFDEQRVLPPTPRLAVSQEPSDPLVFELMVQQAGFAINLVYFDVSGEDCLDEAVLLRNGRHILDADAFIMAMPVNRTEATDIFANSTRRVFETLVAAAILSGRSAAALASTPFVVALTKVDRLAARGRLDSRLTDGVRHKGKVSTNFLRSANDLGRQLLASDPEGARLLQMLDLRLKRLACFPVSSLGADPDESGHIEMPHPHRIEEPLLWLLMASRLMRAEP